MELGCGPANLREHHRSCVALYASPKPNRYPQALTSGNGCGPPRSTARISGASRHKSVAYLSPVGLLARPVKAKPGIIGSLRCRTGYNVPEYLEVAGILNGVHFAHELIRKSFEQLRWSGAWLDQPPSAYSVRRWAWNGDLSTWHHPSHWESFSLGSRPAIRVGGPSWQLGWPMEFDAKVLYNFLLRFHLFLPSTQSEGTILVWILRSHPAEHLDASELDADISKIPGYQFALILDGTELRIRGSAIRRGDSRPIPLDGKALSTGLHYYGKPTTYSFGVRAFAHY